VADFDAVAVTVDGAPVRLTPRVRAPDVSSKTETACSRAIVLLSRVWGYDESIETRSVDVHVGRLRSKLGTVNARPSSDWVTGSWNNSRDQVAA
jgi:DNA-binding response OmpR family regulator